MGWGNLAGQAADERAAHQPCQRLDEKIPGIVIDALGGPFLYGNVANECGMLIGKQLEARQAVRQPAYIFGGTAHQAVCFADEPPMERATWRLNKAEHYKLRRRGFEKRQPARSSPGFNPGVKKITDKKSG